MNADIVVVEEILRRPFDGLSERYTILHRPDAWQNPEALLEAAKGSTALVIGNRTRVDGRLLQALPSLRIVARAGTGLDNIDLQAADARGVVVIAASGANARSVAEHTLGLALGLARSTPALDRAIRGGRWERRPGIELDGRTWGLIGLGSTGREVARLVGAMGMKVIGHDPFVPGAALAGVGVELVELDDLLARATFVSLHIPLNDETRGLVDARFLEKMDPGSYLINVSRGGVVDEEALAEALESGVIAGAALDVRDREPPLLGPLERSDRTVLTPHIAGLTLEAQEEVAELLAQDLDRLLSGEEARGAVGRCRRVS